MTQFSTSFDPLKGSIPPGSKTPGFLFGMNDSGQYIGGFWNEAINTQSLFIYRDGTYTVLTNPLSIAGNTINTGIWGSEISDSGKIVGNIFGQVNNIPVNHGFIFSNNKFVQLDHPGASTTVSYTIPGPQGDFKVSGTVISGINDLGQMVGNYVDSSGKIHGYLYSNNIFTTLDNPQGVGKTTVDDINNKGQIVGSYFDSAGKSHGFIYSDGQYTTVDNSQGVGTRLTDINDSGFMLGSYLDSNNKLNPFVYKSGVFTSIPGFENATGFVGGSINDKSQIVGTYYTGDPAKGNAVFNNYQTQLYDISSVSQNAFSDSTYLLYQASFARMPDEGGFKYWADQAAINKLTFNQLANAFMASPEFKTVFGTNPSNSEYVLKLYNNVLGRDPDASGAQFWTKQLDSGVARDTVLVGFALSPENVSGTASHMNNGYWVL